MSIPDQTEVLATEITKTKVASKTKVTDDVAAATKKADETTLFAKPAPETARSKISANKGDKGDLVEAEPTQTARQRPSKRLPCHHYQHSMMRKAPAHPNHLYQQIQRHHFRRSRIRSLPPNKRVRHLPTIPKNNRFKIPVSQCPLLRLHRLGSSSKIL